MKTHILDIEGHQLVALASNEDKPGTPVVFLHGITMSINFWMPSLPKTVKQQVRWYSLSLLPPEIDRLPIWLQRLSYNLFLFCSRDRMSAYGVPIPKHKILQEHPTISSELLTRVGHGKIEIKPNVKELAGDRVRFADGTEEPIDIIIYATSYKIAFPFFDPSFINFQNNEMPLYKRVVHMDYPNLYFIGLVQPWGAIMPLAELQSQWVAELLEGKIGLPSKEAMELYITKEREAMSKRYVNSKRHTIQVDFQPYVNQVKKEIKSDRKRPPQKNIKPLEILSSVTDSI